MIFYSVVYTKYDRDDKHSGEQLLSSKKMMIDSCTLHKILLVVFFRPRALLSLPQSSHRTNTGLSRASLNHLCQCDMECPAMVCIAVQSKLRSINDV